MKFEKYEIINHTSPPGTLFIIIDVDEETRQYKVMSSDGDMEYAIKYSSWLKEIVLEKNYVTNTQRNRERKLKDLLEL